jgi:peptidoglycan L-alanyl-D-glutamate endopeptidase CwlK
VTELDQRSLRRLEGVHHDLVHVVRKAASFGEMSFIVTEGLRTEERQKKLLAAGASQTMRSRHLTGHAVDLAVLVDGEVRWDWPLYDKLGELMKRAARSLEPPVPLEWGGDWKTFRDGPHFQLPRGLYPDPQPFAQESLQPA